jgi:hypothetical protein
LGLRLLHGQFGLLHRQLGLLRRNFRLLHFNSQCGCSLSEVSHGGGRNTIIKAHHEVAIRIVELGLDVLQRVLITIEVEDTRHAAGKRDGF